MEVVGVRGVIGCDRMEVRMGWIDEMMIIYLRNLCNQKNICDFESTNFHFKTISPQLASSSIRRYLCSLRNQN
jgi:hypothetical protein